VVVCLGYFIPDLPPLLYRIKWDCQEKYLFFFNYFSCILYSPMLLYVIKKARKMTKETTQQTINTIKTTDSLKAVKVAYDLTANTMTSMSTLAETVKKNTDNLNLLAAEVLELKKEIKRISTIVEGL